MNLRISGLRLAIITAFAVSCLLGSAQSLAQDAYITRYSITDLGTLVGGTASRGFAINSQGEITGLAQTASGHEHAFRYDGRTIIDLGTLGGFQSTGYGINASGTVTGSADTADAGTHAFVDNGIAMQDIGTLGGTPSYSVGIGINDNGEVAGISNTVPSGSAAFIYDGTTMTNLGSLLDNGSIARSINDNGKITGVSFIANTERAFVSDAQSVTYINTCTFGYSINNNNEITGFICSNITPNHAFLYNGSSIYDLGTLGGSFSEGYSINDKEQIVGASATAAGATDAFLYDQGKMRDLNTLIEPTSPLYSVVSLNEAQGINYNGQIVANGYYTSGPLSGQYHAFRLDPVPVFAGTPGQANCHGQSVSALAQQYGGLNSAAAALGFFSVDALQNAILAFCED